MPPVSSIWIPIAEGAQLVHELQPDALADILGIGVAQPVPAADGPDQRGVPLHQRVPRLPVAFLARVTRSVTNESSRLRLASLVRLGFVTMAFSWPAPRPDPDQDPGAA
jgi:hypothetical protein